MVLRAQLPGVNFGRAERATFSRSAPWQEADEGKLLAALAFRRGEKAAGRHQTDYTSETSIKALLSPAEVLS